MKKPTQASLLRESRLSFYALRSIFKRHRKILKLRRRAVQARRAVRTATVTAPEEICFHGDNKTRGIFFDLINRVDRHLQEGKKVKIDLRKIKLLRPCGVLLLLSHVRRWTTAYPQRVTANYPADEVVEQMLQSVKILQKLGLADRARVTREEVLQWFHFTGDTVDASPITPFMELALTKLGNDKQSALYEGIVEAITNVTHHAYDVEQNTRWWMFATVTPTHVLVSILDGGKSIPATITEKPLVKDRIKALNWKLRQVDRKILVHAMGGASRTHLPYRGKGLKEMRESTKTTADSSLTIYSRRALFYCDSFGSDTSGDLKTPIDGTLLMWSLKTLVDADHDTSHQSS